MKNIMNWGVGMWVLASIFVFFVWVRSYQAGFDKCTSQYEQASAGDVQALIAQLDHE